MLLRDGQVAKFGRSDWADFPFPEDPQLADVHFEVDCSNQRVMLTAISPDHPVSLRGNPVSKTELVSNDLVCAGGSEFLFSIEGQNSVSNVTSGDRNELSSMPDPVVERAEYLELSELSLEESIQFDRFTAFGEHLKLKNRWEDAFLWIAFHADKREAIVWALQWIESVQEKLSLRPNQTKALDLVRAWLQTPTDAVRMECNSYAEKLGWRGVGVWLACAVGSSGGSMAPDGFEVVPPDPRATARWVRTCLLVVHGSSPSASSNDFAQKILQHAPKFHDPLARQGTSEGTL